MVTKKREEISGGIGGISDYQLLKDAYFGDGGFADGTYLEPHKRERPENYASRKAVSYFLNYVAPVVNSHVDPVFKSAAKRDWTGGGALFEAFREDVDRAGTKLENFIRQAALMAKLLGVVFVLADNDAEINAAGITIADSLAQKKYPYIFTVQPDIVEEYTLDKFGNLTDFSYRDKDPDDEKLEIIRGWTQAEWYIKDKTGKISKRGENPTGRVPVVPFYGRQVKNEFMPRSEFFSCVRANMNIFNLCSKLDQIFSDVTFPLLKYPKMNVAELTIGTGNAIGWDGATNAGGPSFIAPPSDPATVIMAQIDRLIKEIYRMAVLSHVMGVEQQTSGIAKQWDFERTNEALSSFAKSCRESEEAIVELFEAWSGEQVGYTAEYPDDFGVVDQVTAITVAQTALELATGGLFDTEIRKGVAKTLFQNIPTDKYDAIIKNIEERSKLKAAAPVAFPGFGPGTSTGAAKSNQFGG